ncbi:hypothetical protein BV372_22535 [Nostoc sp. T09]|uniref:acyltransferase family protein n=1 Tax=Nostoc sp. T09 TaxID=1932621 RepID=UPI000A3AFF9F|nr:acyltransferase [Nostoc sp. T09]OUL29875.1 hypothetical protein BV372_22535 [Nostoc sp. T09]
MTHLFSILLDLVRVVSAFSVTLSHSSYLTYTGEFKEYFLWAGHPAVMIFFVLSGYVIAFSSETKHSHFSSYFIARLVRLYPVYIFALILVPILDFFGQTNAPEIYARYTYSDFKTLFLIHFFFLQETDLFYKIKYFSDGPLWSLSYEFWFYTFFGLLYYHKKLFYNNKFLSLGCLILGISLFLRIILLFPVWLFGVALYKINTNKDIKLSPQLCLYGCIGAWLLFLIIVFPSPIGHLITQITYKFQLLTAPELSQSISYIKDYLIGFVFTAFLFFLNHLLQTQNLATNTIAILLKPYVVTHAIRTFSGFSYSLYVLHVPLIIYLSSFNFVDKQSLLQQIVILAIVYLIIYLLSFFLERPNKLILTHVYNHFKIVR